MMGRNGKPIRHGNKDFPSLKEMAEYYGVGSSAICANLGAGHWRGEKLYYTRPTKNSSVNRVYINHEQHKWLHEQKPEGASIDDLLAAILTDAMAEAA